MPSQDTSVEQKIQDTLELLKSFNFVQIVPELPDAADAFIERMLTLEMSEEFRNWHFELLNMGTDDLSLLSEISKKSRRGRILVVLIKNADAALARSSAREFVLRIGPVTVVHKVVLAAAHGLDTYMRDWSDRERYVIPHPIDLPLSVCYRLRGEAEKLPNPALDWLVVYSKQIDAFVGQNRTLLDSAVHIARLRARLGYTFADFKKDFEERSQADFQDLWRNVPERLREQIVRVLIGQQVDITSWQPIERHVERGLFDNDLHCTSEAFERFLRTTPEYKNETAFTLDRWRWSKWGPDETLTAMLAVLGLFAVATPAAYFASDQNIYVGAGIMALFVIIFIVLMFLYLKRKWD